MSDLPTSSLVTLLSSPDPHERDETAYTELARRIAGGDEDHALARIGDLMATRFSDSEIQARTFAALILAEVLDRDRITGLASQSSVTRWRDAFAAWYRSEADLRGWDDRLGWLHAIAHGADALGAFGRSPRLDPDDLTGLLALGRDRLLTGTKVVFANQEDDRLAYAIALVLTRQELEGHQITGWLEGVRVRFAAIEEGPVPPWASNTMRTLRMLYVMADRGISLPGTKAGGPIVAIRHDIALRAALAQVLRLSWPYLG